MWFHECPVWWSSDLLPRDRNRHPLVRVQTAAITHVPLWDERCLRKHQGPCGNPVWKRSLDIPRQITASALICGFALWVSAALERGVSISLLCNSARSFLVLTFCLSYYVLVVITLFLHFCHIIHPLTHTHTHTHTDVEDNKAACVISQALCVCAALFCVTATDSVLAAASY